MLRDEQAKNRNLQRQIDVLRTQRSADDERIRVLSELNAKQSLEIAKQSLEIANLKENIRFVLDSILQREGKFMMFLS